MLIDGLTVAAGSGFQIKMLDDTRRGPAFPDTPNTGDLWELTDSVNAGVYEYQTQWILRNPAFSALSYDLSGTVFGKPEPSAKIMYYVASRTFYIQGALAGALAYALQAPALAQDFPITLTRNQSPMYIGTIHFDAFSEKGQFNPASQEPIRVQRGDIIMITAPDVVDELMADISFTLCGYLSI